MLNVQLRPEVEKFVREQVEAGKFTSPSHVLEAGVARLMLDPSPEELGQDELEELRRGLHQMRRGEVIDWKEFAAAVRARLQER